MTLDAKYIDAIKGFEGYNPRASWDYKQHSVGYGTRARYPGEVIDQAEAERRLQAEIANARSIVDRVAPNAPEGVKAALTSLTYNSGSDWVDAGLGHAIKAGDYNAAKDRFLQYNKADGQTLPGLVSRRQAEAAWFDGQPANSNGEKPVLLATMAPKLASMATGTAAAGSNPAIDSIVNSIFGKGGGTGDTPAGNGNSPFGSLKIGGDLEGMKATMQGLDQPDRSPLAGMAQQQPLDLTRLRQVVASRPALGITRNFA